METAAAGVKKPHVLLGCTGSVASIKLPELVAALGPVCEVRVMATERALSFFDRDQLPVRLYTDQDEWTCWSKRGDPVLHIDLRNWADLLLLAPLDANSLAKLANGLADNLLTCVARAWPIGAGRPVVFAPAMNSAMFVHPLTADHIGILTGRLGFVEVPVVTKTLMCGETGPGAMATVDEIVRVVQHCLQRTAEKSSE